MSPYWILLYIERWHNHSHHDYLINLLLWDATNQTFVISIIYKGDNTFPQRKVCDLIFASLANNPIHVSIFWSQVTRVRVGRSCIIIYNSISHQNDNWLENSINSTMYSLFNLISLFFSFVVYSIKHWRYLYRSWTNVQKKWTCEMLQLQFLLTKDRFFLLCFQIVI